MQQVLHCWQNISGVDLADFTLVWEEGTFWVLSSLSLEMLEHVVTLLCNFVGLNNRKLELAAPF